MSSCGWLGGGRGPSRSSRGLPRTSGPKGAGTTESELRGDDSKVRDKRSYRIKNGLDTHLERISFENTPPTFASSGPTLPSAWHPRLVLDRAWESWVKRGSAKNLLAWTQQRRTRHHVPETGPPIVVTRRGRAGIDRTIVVIESNTVRSARIGGSRGGQVRETLGSFQHFQRELAVGFTVVWRYAGRSGGRGLHLPFTCKIYRIVRCVV